MAYCTQPESLCEVVQRGVRKAYSKVGTSVVNFNGTNVTVY
jgi:hypothetical protein